MFCYIVPLMLSSALLFISPSALASPALIPSMAINIIAFIVSAFGSQAWVIGLCWTISIPSFWWLASTRLKAEHLNSLRLSSVEFIISAASLLLPSFEITPDVYLPATIALLAILGYEIHTSLSRHMNHNGWNRDIDPLALLTMLISKGILGLSSTLLGLGIVSSQVTLCSILLALTSTSLYLMPLASLLTQIGKAKLDDDTSPPHPPIADISEMIRKSIDVTFDRRKSSEEVMKNVRGLFSTVSGSVPADTFNSIPLMQLRELAQSRMKEDIELDIEYLSFLQLVKLSRGEHVPADLLKPKTHPISRTSSLPQYNFTTPENIGQKASKHSSAPPPPSPPSPPPVLISDAPWKEVVELLWNHSSEIAHDMKNPLSGVLALSQNVIAGVFGELPKGAQDQMHVVRACAYHLLNMINMLRDMIKMLASGQADMSMNKVGLDGPVEEIMGRMSPMVGNRITIHFEKTPPEEVALRSVLADDQRLYQVLHCVIANAFKYTRKGSVHIESELLPDKRYLSFRVVDTGTGFTQEQLDKFNKVPPPNFTRENVKEQIGLGLVMVRRIMAEFGGSLRITNSKKEGGQGSSGATVELIFRTDREAPAVHATASGAGPAVNESKSKTKLQMKSADNFKAVMAGGGSGSGRGNKRSSNSGATATAASPPSPQSAPTKPRQSSTPPPSPPFAIPSNINKARGSNTSTGSGNDGGQVGGGGGGGLNPLTNAKILIVDDDPINLTILEDLLGNEGYLLVTAANGTEALEVYMTTDPPVQLVLLDVTLPDMSGHEVCLKMRSLTPGVPPPIIMISGKASTKDVIKGLQAGSCDYITKPFQPQEVLARVETQLRLFTGEVGELQEQAERSMALLTQVLPPHILASLKGGNRILVERAQEVCVLVADIASFGDLSTHTDASDCILALNKIFCTFDSLIDKYGVRKIDVVNDSYVAAVGHLREDIGRSAASQATCVLECCKEMMEVVRQMGYPASLGRLELRIGVHIGPVFTGIMGIKFPRYSFFGSTIKLASALNKLAPPMTIHVSDMVQSRASKGPTNEKFIAFTQSSFPGMGVFRTHLLQTQWMSLGVLQAANVAEFLIAAANNASTLGSMQVMQTLVGSANSTSSGSANASHAPLSISITGSIASHSVQDYSRQASHFSSGIHSKLAEGSARSIGSNLLGPMFASRVSRDGGGMEGLSRQSIEPLAPSKQASSIPEANEGGPEEEDGGSPRLVKGKSQSQEIEEDEARDQFIQLPLVKSTSVSDMKEAEGMGSGSSVTRSGGLSGALDGLLDPEALNRQEPVAGDPEPTYLASPPESKSKRRPAPSGLPSFRFSPAAANEAASALPSDQLTSPSSNILVGHDESPRPSSPKRKPSSPSELFSALGIGHYGPKMEAHLLALAAKDGVVMDEGEEQGPYLLKRLALMDDEALKKAGIITAASRANIKTELENLNL